MFEERALPCLIENRPPITLGVHPSRAVGFPTLDDPEVLRLAALGKKTLEVSHDLGNILQIVLSAIRLVEQRLSSTTREELQPLTGEALRAIDRATALRRRLLEDTRPHVAANSVIHLGTLLSEMGDIISLAVGPTVEIKHRYAADVPAIACNRTDLENVILNLVINSRDAMDACGALTLSVQCYADEQGPLGRQPTVLFKVTDTGCGMSPDVAARAFKPFFTTKLDRDGTGLGLASVAAFVQRLGGSVAIESAEGQGCTISLWLPSCGA